MKKPLEISPNTLAHAMAKFKAQLEAIPELTRKHLYENNNHFGMAESGFYAGLERAGLRLGKRKRYGGSGDGFVDVSVAAIDMLHVVCGHEGFPHVNHEARELMGAVAVEGLKASASEIWELTKDVRYPDRRTKRLMKEAIEIMKGLCK
jgi:hypothetical protein